MNFPILAIGLATSVAFVIGGIWYGALFRQAWQAEQNWTDADAAQARARSARLFATTLVCEAIITTVLAHVLGRIPHDPAITLMVVLGTAVGFVIPALAVNYGYAQNSLKLLLIDAGHWLAVFLGIAVVFIALRG